MRLSMNHEASLSSHQVTKGGSSLQRSASLHGAAAGSGSQCHSNASNSHHPQPQHHHARHFAPYHITHHNHHHHARFDLPEEEKDPANNDDCSSRDRTGVIAARQSRTVTCRGLFPHPLPYTPMVVALCHYLTCWLGPQGTSVLSLHTINSRVQIHY
jgi:hypothetical protein